MLGVFGYTHCELFFIKVVVINRKSSVCVVNIFALGDKLVSR